MCGKRWFVKKDGNKFGTWLDKREKELGKEFCIFI